MKMSTILAAIVLIITFAGVSFGQTVTVDFSKTTSAIPNVFGSSGADLSQPILGLTRGVGITLVCKDYYMSRIVPNTTLSTYQAALAASCPGGSVCDPNTWNWYDTDNMQAVKSAGYKVMGIMDYLVPFDSTNGNNTGDVIDYTVYEDIVRKLVQHFTPDFIEVDNEPDGCQLGCKAPADYAVYYYHVAHAIRSVNSTVPIGGPTTGVGNTAYITAMQANVNILSSYVEFITQHGYGSNSNANFDTSMLSAARTKWPTVVGYVTEWNADGSCPIGNNLDSNDPSTVARVGAHLISAITAGQGALYYSAGSHLSQSCAWYNDTSTALLPKAYAWEVLNQIGAGAGSVMSTTFSGLTQAVGIVNSVERPAVVLANWSSPLNATVTLNNLSLSGAVGVTVYMADFVANNGTVPFSTFDTNVTGGSTTFTIPMTADSIAGVVLGSPVPTPTPTPTGTPTPTPTPTPGASNWIGYAVTLRR